MDEAEFDRFADEYYQQHVASIRLSGEAPEFFHRYKVEDVAATLRGAGTTPLRILDFGAGVGNSLGAMTEAFPTSEIVLLDPSARSLEVARARHPGKAHFQHFDGGQIPFEDGAFDLVFAACVFHHIPSSFHVPLLKEIRRVMKRGASIFVFEHNPVNPLTRKAVRDCPFDENAVLISAGTMKARLRDAGLPDCSVAYRIFFPGFLSALRALEPMLRGVPLGAQYYVHAIKRDG
ncbi:class I SAM-dependent methyltransferase [Sinorhizobium alkalisoli]|uniref:SAM-dependent methyltransferase n=1 Tax=Sinorhizobium alkalisoli TaxID=1752398 RepID=A0A1E3VAF8_9HYPH|nr:class I SAM-dependent methyltransferase [Sinorhizobium alkalisoli]MCG5481018.1 methyltransferase domain-containing protein [Sinorhizobium alkalisoli]ODR90417.1 SAM-dependent methyltransferase [Sinorhizobium alkalisoli]